MPLKYDLAAFFTPRRPHVDDMIAEPDHSGIVFDHYHRVAHRHEALELVHEALLVPCVESDARFVEHIEHIHQGRPQRAGKMHPLHFAA